MDKLGKTFLITNTIFFTSLIAGVVNYIIKTMIYKKDYIVDWGKMKI